MINRAAFTMLELIFVIVIMGILGKFGVEFLAQAYNNFMYSKISNTLQAQSSTAVEAIASRLQFRIKDSIIGRKSADFNSFEAVASIPVATSREYNILEWVASDIEGFRGDSLPYWSGIIDLDDSSASTLTSPDTNTTAINSLIGILADNNGTADTGINNSAIYFVGSNSNIKTGYGWDGTAITDHNNSVMHPIKLVAGAGNENKFQSSIVGVDFSGTDIYEYYQLAWTAYAVGIADYNNTSNTGTLMLYYDYQPWEGEKYNNANASSVVLMENVSTFQFKAVGSVIKIQVCVNSELMEDYSICKEKTIF